MYYFSRATQTFLNSVQNRKLCYLLYSEDKYDVLKSKLCPVASKLENPIDLNDRHIGHISEA